MIRNFATTFVFISIFHLGLGLQAAAKQPDSPEGIVAEFQLRLIEVMKVSETLTVKQRFDRLAPAVDAAFHMPLMVQIAVGTHWGKTNGEERQNVTKAFRRMSLSTLATLFDGYGGELFAHQKNESGPSGTIIVATDLIKTDKSRVQIAYVMRQFKQGWRIIDVIVDGGISELMVRRSEYRLILKQNGINGLIDLLENKSDQLISESGAK